MEVGGNGTGAVHPLQPCRRDWSTAQVMPCQQTCAKPFLFGTASWLGENWGNGGDASGKECQMALEGLRVGECSWREVTDFDCGAEKILSFS